MPIPAGTLYGDSDIPGGKIAQHHPAEYITTKIAQGALLFGQAAVAGSSVDKVKTPASASDVFKGVAGYSFEASDLDDSAYADGDTLALVEAGIVSVYCEEAVDPTSPVRIRHTAGTGTYAGSFCKTAEAGRTALLDGAEFKGTIAGPGYVALHLKGIYKLTADAA